MPVQMADFTLLDAMLELSKLTRSFYSSVSVLSVLSFSFLFVSGPLQISRCLNAIIKIEHNICYIPII